MAGMIICMLSLEKDHFLQDTFLGNVFLHFDVRQLRIMSLVSLLWKNNEVLVDFFKTCSSGTILVAIYSKKLLGVW